MSRAQGGKQWRGGGEGREGERGEIKTEPGTERGRETNSNSNSNSDSEALLHRADRALSGVGGEESEKERLPKVSFSVSGEKGRRLRVAGCVQMEPPSSGLEASEQQLAVPPAIKVRPLAGGDAVSVGRGGWEI